MTQALPSIPPDFPGAGPGAVSGYQPKLVGRLVDGRFVEGLTQEELYERFDACADLVVQLTAYSRRKLVELPDTTVQTLLPRVKKGVLAKGWDLSPAELDWIMKHVEAELAGSAGSQTGSSGVPHGEPS